MRILFLLKSSSLHERLGLMQISAILKEKGHKVALLLTGGLSAHKCLDYVTSYKPHVLAYSIMTGEHNYHITLNQEIRAHYDCMSIFGGPHPTYYPEMVRKSYVDAICRGEGDIYFPELIDRIEQGRDYFDVPSFHFQLDNGTIIENAIGPLCTDLDILPFPDRAIMYDADPTLYRKGIRIFLSMRGCPYNCTYCLNHAYRRLTCECGPILRWRSVDRVIEEITQVRAAYFLDCVYFGDDVFLLKPDGWLEEFADKYSRIIGLPLACQGRANLINDHTGELLHRMGCTSLQMGVECGNEQIASQVLGRNLDNEGIIKARDVLRRYRIPVETTNLLGLPVDRPLETDLQTLDFNISLKPNFACTSLLYPYPTTDITHLAVSRGMFDANYDTVHTSNKTYSALNFDNARLKRKIENLHKLFGLIVRWPWLRPLTSILISLPLTRAYTAIFFAFYGYKYILSRMSPRAVARIIVPLIVSYVRYLKELERNKAL